MVQPLNQLKESPSQTAGPYVHIGCVPNFCGIPGVYPQDNGAEMVNDKTKGERITVTGIVHDGTGTPLKDVLVEIWQADGQGRYAHPADPRGSNIGFRSFGRVGTGTDPEHRFRFETVKPGAPAPGQAPHINLVVFMRGLLSHLYTRIYFDDEAEANATDPVLTAVPEDRRETLVARREQQAGGTVYRFDLHLQGARETVFFDL